MLDNNGSLSLDAVIEIGVQLCEALGYLHGQHPPIIHRDLKPTNVMMDRSGFVRLIDFGIARSFKHGKHQFSYAWHARLCRSGAGRQTAKRRQDRCLWARSSIIFLIKRGKPLHARYGTDQQVTGTSSSSIQRDARTYAGSFAGTSVFLNGRNENKF